MFEYSVFATLAIVTCALAISDGIAPMPPGCPQKVGPPCPRYYQNPYPDYTPGDSTVLPLDVKTNMQNMLNTYVDIVLNNAPPTGDDQGWNVFTGSAGRAMVFLRLYNNTKNSTYLGLARQYIDYSLEHMTVTPTTQISFLESSNGVNALAAVIYSIQNQTEQSKEFIAAVITGFENAHRSKEATYDTGKAGLLMTGKFLNNYFGIGTIPSSLIVQVAEQILDASTVDPTDGHLSWNNYVFKHIVFWGQGHGSTGVITQLLDVPEITQNATYSKMIADTLDYYTTIQLPSGNFPTPEIEPYPLQPDILVQWCHGSPGFIPVLTKGWSVYGNTKWLDSARKAADNVWEKGILTKGLMLGHGISGNTYMMLFLHKATNDVTYLYRSIKFQEFVLDTPLISDPSLMRKPTPSPYMPYVGSYCGAIVLWSDMLTLNNYNMPGFAPYI